jgi:dTDP-4-dehydrorhamnose reductase
MTSPRLLVLGDTGLAGTAVVQAARARGLEVAGASRRGEIRLDLRDADGIAAVVAEVKPSHIVNAAALVSVPDCEADPGLAWSINARPAALLAQAARGIGARVTHISTDHYFTGDGARAHDEDAPVTLVNEYARSKYAAEALALTHADTVVVRTNLIGLASATGGSFGEWAMRVIANDEAATLFEDQFVSILDVWSLAEGLLDLAQGEARGVVNLASSQVFSKAELVEAIAAAMGRTLTRARRGSVQASAVPRPDSLGLDVRRAEAILGRRLPTLAQVAQAVATKAAETGTAEARDHALGR